MDIFLQCYSLHPLACRPPRGWVNSQDTTNNHNNQQTTTPSSNTYKVNSRTASAIKFLKFSCSHFFFLRRLCFKLLTYLLTLPDKMASLITPKKVDSSGSHNAAKEKSTAGSSNKSTVNSSKGGSGHTIKWPPASSTKSLPPLSGRISDLLDHSQHMNNDANKTLKSNPALSTRDTIEFEVNQECNFVDIENLFFPCIVLLSFFHVTCT